MLLCFHLYKNSATDAATLVFLWGYQGLFVLKVPYVVVWARLSSHSGQDRDWLEPAMLTLLTVHDTLGWLTIVDMSIMQQVPRSVGDNMTVQHKYTHAHVTLSIVINQIRVKHNNTVRKETVFCKRDYVTLPTACQGRCAVTLISACRYLQLLSALIVCIVLELKMYFVVISVSNTNFLSW